MFGRILMVVVLVFKACLVIGQAPVFVCSADGIIDYGIRMGQTTATSCEYDEDSGTVTIYVLLQPPLSADHDQARFTIKRTGLTTMRYERLPDDFGRVYPIPITLVDADNGKVVEICAEYHGAKQDTDGFTIRCIPIIVTDNGPVAVTPEVSLAEGPYVINEGGQLTVMVNILNAGDPVDVEFEVRPLTASSTDYSLDTTSPVTTSSAMIPITLSAMIDSDLEGVEVFEISLIQSTSTPSAKYTIGAIAKAIVFIREVPTVTLEECTYAVTEGASVAVNIVNGGDKPVNVEIKTRALTADSTDYSIDRTTVSVLANSMSPVTVSAVDDGAVEGSEELEISIAEMPETYGAGTPSKATVYIKDPAPAASEYCLGNTLYPIMESNGPVEITIYRKGNLSQAGSVVLSSTNVDAITPSDYAGTSLQVMFGPGLPSQKVDIEIMNDDQIEASECFQVALSQPNGGEMCTLTSATVIIKDDDCCFALESRHYTAVESSAPFDVCVVKTGYLGGDSSVGLQTTSGSAQQNDDFTAVSTNLQFGSGAAIMCVPGLMIKEDGEYERPEQFTVSISTTDPSQICDPSTATVTIKSSDSSCVLPCQNGGICFGNGACFCPSGFTGSQCEINPGSCPADYCLNSGTCITRGRGYSCQCTEGYEGAKCEERIADQSGGVIAGIVISSVVGLAIVSFLLLALFRLLVQRAAKPNGRSTASPMNNRLGNGGALFTDGTVVQYPYQPDTMF